MAALGAKVRKRGSKKECRGGVPRPVFKIMNKEKNILSEGKMSPARDLENAFGLVSPFIEKHTALVCPECENVCCMDRHGRYDENDLFFLRALGVDIPSDRPDLAEIDPCRSMTATGCALERWMRPYRCTFFFCDALLKSLENDNAKLYRAFLQYFQHLVDMRQKLLE